MDGQTSSKESDQPQLERFNPVEMGGRLIDAEHRGRYWWASQVAAGKDVLDAACGTGYGSEILAAAGAASVSAVDIDEGAVELAARRLGGLHTVHRADLRELPFEDDSFDLIVCWEAIEHIEKGEAAIAEFRRVLRGDGFVLTSSPNPLVYPPGNDHHVHEYRPTELAELLGREFANVASYRQHAWLASVIESAANTTDQGEESSRPTRSVEDLPVDGETYSLVVAGDSQLPKMRDLITLGSAFEVRWWQNSFNEAKRLMVAAEAREGDALWRQRETSNALLDSNQSLAQIPVLEHRLEEMRATVEMMKASRSWRVTALLRWFTRRQRG